MRLVRALSGSGSIPARAGEPGECRPALRRYAVYPRACGGTFCNKARALAVCGLSPRVRGNPPIKDGMMPRTRSIPARAGEPPVGRRSFNAMTVYPRACGGTPDQAIVEFISGGLSPRVRGNRLRHRAYPRCAGSIPARAGERCRRCKPATWLGLSPRVRGNSRTARYAHPVYPRACGGTPSGLARGHIPARAGEPRRRRPTFPTPKVYVRGRVGSNRRRPRAAGGLRSIPARAGEPLGKLIVSICHHSPRERD